MRALWQLCAATSVVCALFPRAASADCPNVIGASADVDALDPSARAAFVRRSLDDDAQNAVLWTAGWAGIGAATTAFNGIWAATGTYDQRIDRLGAASGGVMLLATTLLTPLSVTHDASTIGTAVDASQPGRAGYDPCALAGYSERVLVHAADDEASRKSFVGHALPIGGAVAGGLVLGLGYGHWTSGALNAGIGVILSEVKMLTQPTGAERALERYRSGVLGSDGPAVGWQLTPVAVPQGGGLSLSMRY